LSSLKAKIMFSGSKRMIKLYLLAIVLFLLFGCEFPDDHIQPRGVVFYLYNNSKETAQIIGYKDGDPETVFQELQIFPDQVKEVGSIAGSSSKGLIFQSDRVEVYKCGALIYTVENRRGTSLFADSVEQITENFYIRVAPLFKWCGNELCEEQ
jgi:hypothetical protein